MSATIIARDPAYPPRGTLTAKCLRVSPPYGVRAGGCAVRSESRTEGGAGPVAGSLHDGLHGACTDCTRGGTKGPYICKSLQAWLAPRPTTSLDGPKSSATNGTILFFNVLQLNEKMTDGPGLAHRLRGPYAYGYGHDCDEYAQRGADSASPTESNRRQAPRGRGCATFLPVDQAGARPGFIIPRSRCWRDTTRTGNAGLKVAAAWSRENYVSGASAKTC